MRFFYLSLLLIFPSVSFGDTLNELFLKFQKKSNYYIYQDKKSKWNYECVVYANMKKGDSNINSVNFDQKNRAIKFTFDEPDQPFYKVTKIVKNKPNVYRLYFQDKNIGSDFNFEVILKNNGISEWIYHTPNEDSEGFIDRGFTLVSFDKSPKFNILNKCNL